MQLSPILHHPPPAKLGEKKNKKILEQLESDIVYFWTAVVISQVGDLQRKA